LDRLVTRGVTGLAKRTSRRGFLGRSGRLLVGLVGGSALVGLMAPTAQAACSCPSPCLHWWTCDCGTSPYADRKRKRKHYDCPVCSTSRFYECSYTVCTSIYC
jgi:hypothetical protein